MQYCRLLQDGQDGPVRHGRNANSGNVLGRSARQKALMVFAAIVTAPVAAETGSQLVLAYVVNRHGTRNLLPKLSSALKDANSNQQTVFAQPFGGSLLSFPSLESQISFAQFHCPGD
jgi:hypothetical protein